MPENLPHRAPSSDPMQASDWEGELPERLRDAFPNLALHFKTYLKQSFIEAPYEAVADLLRYLRDQEQFDMLTDLTAVDHPKDPQRFEVIYLLYSFRHNERLRVKARIAEGSTIPTAVDVYAGANW